MSARGNRTDETKTRRRIMAFMGNLMAILSLVVIGYPLAPATIRTMLAAGSWSLPPSCGLSWGIAFSL